MRRMRQLTLFAVMWIALHGCGPRKPAGSTAQEKEKEMCPGWGTPGLLAEPGPRASAAEMSRGSWVEVVLRYQLSDMYDLEGILFAIDGTTVCAAGKSSK